MICSGFVSAKLGIVYFTSKKKGKVRNISYFCNIQQKNIGIHPIFHVLGQKNILCVDGAGEFIFPKKKKKRGKGLRMPFSPPKTFSSRPMGSAKAERN